jgi:AcrR family transcriptional regulator
MAPSRSQRIGSEKSDRTIGDRILEAASLEFAELGIRAAKIASICRRADIANGTFYLHYRTKEAVWAELLQRAASELAERLRISHAIKKLDARSRDRIEVSIIVGFAEERSDMFRFMMGERSGQVAVHNVFFDQLNDQRCEAIRQGIADGEFRSNLNPMIAALADIGATTEIIQWWLRNPDKMTREMVIDHLIDLRARMFFPD